MIKLNKIIIAFFIILNSYCLYAAEYYSYQPIYGTTYVNYDSDTHNQSYYDYFDTCISENVEVNPGNYQTFHTCTKQKLGFRDLGNPNDGEIICKKPGIPDDSCLANLNNNEFEFSYKIAAHEIGLNTFPDYELLTSYYIPPYLMSINGTYYINIDADLAFCMKYKDKPVCDATLSYDNYNSESEVGQDTFLNIYSQEIYLYNRSGHIQPIPSRSFPENYFGINNSGWFFVNQIHNLNGLGIQKVHFRYNVDYYPYRNWYNNIKEPESQYYNDKSFFLNNCVDSNHPEDYLEHRCIDDNCIDEVKNASGFNNRYDNTSVYYYEPYYYEYFTKKGDNSGKKYYFCWYPAGNYPDSRIIWDIWSNDVAYPNSVLTPCSSYTNENNCSANNCNWYHDSCNDTELCDNYPEYFDNSSECENCGYQWIDNSSDKRSGSCEFKCDSEHLDKCYDHSSCEDVGGYWYHDSCNDSNQTVACKNNLTFCDNQSICESAGNEWKTDNGSDEILGYCDFKCGNTHLDKCSDETECSGAGGVWSNNSCSEKVNCTSNNLSDCKDAYSCGMAGGAFINGVCQVYISQCSSSNLSACKDKNSCENAGGYWKQIAFIGQCEVSGENPCDAAHLNLCNNEADCKNKGGYWYDNKCNSKPNNICSSQTLNKCDSETECKNAGGCWVNNQCVEGYPAMPQSPLIPVYDFNDNNMDVVTVSDCNKIFLNPVMKITDNNTSNIKKYFINIEDFNIKKEFLRTDINQGHITAIGDDSLQFNVTGEKSPISVDNLSCKKVTVKLGYKFDNGSIKETGYIIKIDNGSCNWDDNTYSLDNNFGHENLESKTFELGNSWNLSLEISKKCAPSQYYALLSYDNLSLIAWFKGVNEFYGKNDSGIVFSKESITENGNTIKFNLLNNVKSNESSLINDYRIYAGYRCDNTSKVYYNGIKVKIIGKTK